MEEFKPLIADMKIGLIALQRLQAGYDDVGWDISDSNFHKFRHITIHLSALVGKISSLCEQLDHSNARSEFIEMERSRDVLRSAASNIMFHVAQIANLADFELGSAMLDRYAENAKRFAPESVFASLNQEA